MSNPKWVQIALAEQGQAEIAGGVHNPRIVAYHAVTGLKAKDDETPWCASFVGWCLAEAGLKSTSSAAARSYETWGVRLEQPVLGAVVTFTRAGGGHVGFYMGQRDGKWLILGGNQSNRVSIMPYDPNRMTAIRWPAGVPLPVAVQPLAKSGVIRGSMLSGASTLGAIGAGLLSNKDAVDTAAGWMSQGNPWAMAFGVLALAGVAYTVISRVQAKKEAAE